MSGKDWMNNPKFNHFWANYHQGQAWLLKHKNAYWKSKALSIGHENKIFQSLIQHVCQTGLQFKQQDDLINYDSKSIDNQITISEPTMNYSDNADDIEMEISSDMLEFLSCSMEHKKERREIDSASYDQTAFIDIDKIPVETRATGATALEMNESLQTSYDDLYGFKATTVLAMETAVQVNFHRNCDRKQPKLWPNMPLNF